MRGFNHIAGGLAFTGIFASFADVNIFSKPEYVVACVFFSLLADIDHTQSTIGKLFWPLAKWVDKKWGHRTVTHSLPFYLAILAGVGVAELLLTGGRTVTGIAALAYGSHLLFDMCTRAGIPLFLPVTRARCVLPGNPDLRMSSKKPFTEVAVFFGFVLLNLSALPLMANGFWVTLNNEFATLSHVERESHRRNDILYLETTSGKGGQVVKVTETGAMIYNGREFLPITPQDTIKQFHHTGKKTGIGRIEFVAISVDSLRKIMKLPLLLLSGTCTVPIRYRIEGQQFEQQKFSIEYPPNFQFTLVPPDRSAAEQQLVRLRAAVAAADAAQAKYAAEQRRKSARIEDLLKRHGQLSEYGQGQAVEEIAKLRAELAAAQPPETGAARAVDVAEIARLKNALRGEKPTFTGLAITWKP